MAVSYDPYLPPLPPSPQEFRRRSRRRWRRTDWILCFLIWLTATITLIRLIELYNIPLPGN
ncbi:MAG: hypothetical protein ACR2JW_12050 [Thermomicrobiales bacterium]